MTSKIYQSFAKRFPSIIWRNGFLEALVEIVLLAQRKEQANQAQTSSALSCLRGKVGWH